MATFYIKSSGGIFELTSTTAIQVDHSSTISKHKVENGTVVADNIVNDNIRISFSGMISEIKSVSFNRFENDGEIVTTPTGDSLTDVKTYIDALRKIRDNKELFSVIYDNTRFKPANNCVLTKLTIDRDSSYGTGYKVALSFEQVRISERARFSIIRDVQQNPDKTQGKTDSSGTNTVEKPSDTFLRGVGDSINTLIQNITGG